MKKMVITAAALLFVLSAQGQVDSTIHAIRTNTEITANNTLKVIPEYWPFIISIFALLLAGVTLYFTIRTTRSQKRTERNTRKWSSEQELGFLRLLTQSVGKAYRNILTIETLYIKGLMPKKTFFRETLIDMNLFHQETCSEVNEKDYCNLSEKLKILCWNFNKTVNNRLDDLSQQEVEVVTSWNVNSFGPEINTLIDIISTIRILYDKMSTMASKKRLWIRNEQKESFDDMLQACYIDKKNNVESWYRELQEESSGNIGFGDLNHRVVTADSFGDSNLGIVHNCKELTAEAMIKKMTPIQMFLLSKAYEAYIETSEDNNSVDISRRQEQLYSPLENGHLYINAKDLSELRFCLNPPTNSAISRSFDELKHVFPTDWQFDFVQMFLVVANISKSLKYFENKGYNLRPLCEYYSCLKECDKEKKQEFSKISNEEEKCKQELNWKKELSEKMEAFAEAQGKYGLIAKTIPQVNTLTLTYELNNYIYEVSMKVSIKLPNINYYLMASFNDDFSVDSISNIKFIYSIEKVIDFRRYIR